MTEAPARAATEADPGDVGRRLRTLRQTKGISARELASRSGVTAAYVSRVENGRISPTVATLSRMVLAMDETIASLFDNQADPGPVIRGSERMPLRSSGVEDYRVTPRWATRLEVLESVVAPGEGSGPHPHTHPGDEECVVVLEGTLRIWIDDREYLLNPQDAATFACRRPHRWANPGQTPSRVLWIITPAVY